MGCVLYEMLTLHVPFSGANITELMAKIVVGQPVSAIAAHYGQGLRQLAAQSLNVCPALRPTLLEIIRNPLIRPCAKQQQRLLETTPVTHNRFPWPIAASVQAPLVPPESPKPLVKPAPPDVVVPEPLPAVEASRPFGLPAPLLQPAPKLAAQLVALPSPEPLVEFVPLPAAMRTVWIAPRRQKPESEQKPEPRPLAVEALVSVDALRDYLQQKLSGYILVRVQELLRQDPNASKLELQRLLGDQSVHLPLMIDLVLRENQQ